MKVNHQKRSRHKFFRSLCFSVLFCSLLRITAILIKRCARKPNASSQKNNDLLLVAINRMRCRCKFQIECIGSNIVYVALLLLKEFFTLNFYYLFLFIRKTNRNAR